MRYHHAPPNNPQPSTPPWKTQLSSRGSPRHRTSRKAIRTCSANGTKRQTCCRLHLRREADWRPWLYRNHADLLSNLNRYYRHHKTSRKMAEKIMRSLSQSTCSVHRAINLIRISAPSRIKLEMRRWSRHRQRRIVLKIMEKPSSFKNHLVLDHLGPNGNKIPLLQMYRRGLRNLQLHVVLLVPKQNKLKNSRDRHLHPRGKNSNYLQQILLVISKTLLQGSIDWLWCLCILRLIPSPLNHSRPALLLPILVTKLNKRKLNKLRCTEINSRL